MILSPMTGKTHGMTFRMMPPRNMKNMISARPITGGRNGRFGEAAAADSLPRCGEGGIGGGDADAFIAYAKDAGKA